MEGSGFRPRPLFLQMKGVILKPPDVEVKPASISQMQKVGNDWIEVQKDLGEIAAELKKLDRRFVLYHSPHHQIYKITVRETNWNGTKEYLVTTTKHLDRRLINRIQMIMSNDYNYSAELAKQDEKADRDREYAFEQKMAANSEQLAHAIRKDLGLNTDRAFFAARD